jgi:protein-L-isoaspartate O-methyltransferase
MTLTGTYSPDDNKLRLYASTRLDTDTYARVRAAGFIWAPKQDLFVAPMWTPDRADLLLELCGEIGDEDTSLTDRAEERAERFEEYRESRTEDAQQAREAVSRIADGIPMGQPILVGHHSERHARKDAERIENGMRRAIKMWETAQYWQRRAKGAIAHAKYKELPGVRARRIKGLEADRRKHLRAKERSEWFIGHWNANRDQIDAGVMVLTKERAIFLANHDGGYYASQHTHPSGWVGPLSLWEAAGGTIHPERKDDPAIATPEEVRAKAVSNHQAIVAYSERWIAHIDLRLGYEKTMLDEQGGSALLAPKPKTAKAQLPLCNYRAPGGLDIENLYTRGEMIHYPQVEMTQAQYAAINQDYKGTRVVGHSHRVRVAMQHTGGARLVCVFLTDSKVHEVPQAKDAPVRERPTLRPYTPPTPKPDAAAFDAMRKTLKAGVQVVSAPQLFPTPADVARRVVELADVQPGHRVLEPSAGTGRIVDVLSAIECCAVAVEINHNIVTCLRPKYRPEFLTVHTADFLDLTPDTLGTFDRIVMNPPFERGADIRHIEHARQFLKPGGRLVAVCANGPRQQAALQGDAETWITLADGAFAAEGTNVRAAIVVLGAAEERMEAAS